MNIFVNEDFDKTHWSFTSRNLTYWCIFLVFSPNSTSTEFKIYTPTEFGCLVESEKMVMGLYMWDFGVPQGDQV
jgi:hypothetical protein